MIDSAGEPTTIRFSGALLEAKVALRPPRPGAVSRLRLIDRARTSDVRIIEVTAPAGYGKSTLLAEWAAREDRLVAWATVDAFDDDPASLLTLLATACSGFSPQVAEVVAEMSGVDSALLGRSAPMLAAALARVREPFVLFLDDLHLAGSTACQDVLEIVLSAVPNRSQVVIAGRQGQPFLARLRVEGKTAEIDVDALRLDAEGARTIFDESGVTLSQGDVDSAVERCEGWAAGLFLCAMAIAAGADITEFTGGDRNVAEYLYRECLARLPEDLQDFLYQTAVLDQFTSGLCDAVRGADDSVLMLARLTALRLFLAPLGRERRWFRYHPLFREFLLGRLEEVRGRLAVAELHLRAASWFDGQGEPDRAVEHLLAAGAREQAGALIAKVALPTYQRGRVAVVERWLGQLGDSFVEADPELAVLSAWVAILQGKSPDAERWAAVLDRIELGPDRPEEVVAFQSARAMVRAAMCPDGPAQVLADASFAVEHERAGSVWRDQALHLLGEGHLLVGNTIPAREAFTASSACASAAGNPDSVLLSEAELAILAIQDGAWADAEVHAHAAARAIEENHMEGYPTAALALAVNARAALHRGDTGAAERFCARAMRARVHCTHVLPYLAMRVRLQLAELFAGSGDVAAARHLLREIDDLLRRRPRVGVLAEQIQRMRERLERIAMRVATVPLTPAELRLLPYLQTYLTLAEIGSRLSISRNTVSTEVASIYRKLGVTTRAAAVELAIESGLLGT